MPRRSGGVVGLALAAVTVCPKAVNDSIHGNASATPAPRRKWRRERGRQLGRVLMRLLAAKKVS